jgi:glycosyltransferase involved in cell wall biosynthesis
MNQAIKVTIVTPSFNQGQYIEETILSVLNQTYSNIQYIIIDGSSTDNTMEIVNKYATQVDIIIHEKDNGQADAINKGFRLAKGQLAGWINSDDILYPECVEKMVDLYEQYPDGAIFYPALINFIDSKGETIRVKSSIIPDKKSLVNKNYDVIPEGAFYNKIMLEKVSFCNEHLNYCMDLDLWLRLLNYGTIHYLSDKPYSGFRIWENSKTTTGKKKFIKEIHETLKKHGAGFFTKTVLKTRWYLLKYDIKHILGK